MKNNPFKAMSEFYTESVDKCDEAGFSNYYLKAFDLFKTSISKQDKCSFSIIDEYFTSGYYIFGMGTNSVVHFHVKECPGWKFGIWFSAEHKEELVTVQGDFFCQYEEDIDKFKPSASNYNEQFSVNFDTNDNSSWVPSVWSIYRILTFIKKHPLRSWAANYYLYDYNTEYISSLNILWKYLCYKFRTLKEKLVVPILNKLFIKYTSRLFIPTIDEELQTEKCELEIHDSGDFVIPRYSFLIKVPDDSSIETGHFGMFTDKELQRKWDKKKSSFHKIADLLHVYWISPVHDSITLWKEKEQEDV